MTAADELRQLADRLYVPIHIADDFTVTSTDDRRAAAVALRHHATLVEVIGDPDELRTMVAGLVRRVAGIADAAAAVSPSPTPTCPTCGSDDPDWVIDCTDPVDPWHNTRTT